MKGVEILNKFINVTNNIAYASCVVEDSIPSRTPYTEHILDALLNMRPTKYYMEGSGSAIIK